MGCIQGIKIHGRTSVIISNQLNNEINEKRKSQALTEHIYSKRHQINISQTINDLIENNPLPFVKIKRKSNHL